MALHQVSMLATSEFQVCLSEKKLPIGLLMFNNLHLKFNQAKTDKLNMSILRLQIAGRSTASQ